MSKTIALDNPNLFNLKCPPEIDKVILSYKNKKINKNSPKELETLGYFQLRICVLAVLFTFWNWNTSFAGIIRTFAHWRAFTSYSCLRAYCISVAASLSCKDTFQSVVTSLSCLRAYCISVAASLSCNVTVYQTVVTSYSCLPFVLC